MIKSGEVVSIKLVLFEEDENEEKKWESRTREISNKERKNLFPMCPFWMRK
jgi:hypothetical protein